MKQEAHRIRVTLVTPMLGSQPADPAVADTYIGAKAPNATLAAEEKKVAEDADKRRKLELERKANSGDLEADEAEEMMELTKTCIPCDEHGLFLWDYQLKGTIKEAMHTMVELGYAKGVTRWTFKSAVNRLVFPTPRRMYWHSPEGKVIKAPDGDLQRPARGDTLRGERIFLVKSEMLNEGSYCECSIGLIVPNGTVKSKYMITWDDVKSCLDYGGLKGLGQWRSGGWGTFKWTEQK